jgi:uncharacterized membrane protein YjgN (DUF898 family)
MATAEAFGPAAAAGTVRFLGNEGDYWRLRIKGAALVVLTLGIYRFWLATDVRRFLWSNTEIAGDTLEYNGLATELLVGFLFAIAILVPLYTILAVAALELELVALKPAVIGFLLLAVLGEYALYRARRYRLTRTVFRGLRFDQHGSPWLYALFAIVCWAIVIVTLGLAYPWTEAFIERFKMRNTSYGDLQGRFAGSGLSLFLRGLPIWLIIVGPIVGAIAILAARIDWNALSEAIDQNNDDTTANMVGAMLTPAAGQAIGLTVISVIALLLLYPLFQAIKLRWWISGLRFGAMRVSSRLRAGQVYRVYLRLILYFFLLGLLVSAMGGMLIGAVVGIVSPLHNASVTQVVIGAVGILIYVAMAMGGSVVKQVIVVAGLWRIGVETADVTDAQVLDGVRATGTASSAIGEGLADALGVGGI